MTQQVSNLSKEIISVALCTYNGEAFLNYQLESIINQSQLVNEIVICDDGSSDLTKEILVTFQKKYPLIVKTYFNENSLGVLKNFEKAIKLCSGNIIFLSDQDDLWKYNKVETILKKFYSDSSIEAIFSNGELINDNGKLISGTLWNTFGFSKVEQESWRNVNKALIDLIHYRNKITGATLAFKKTLFERCYPFPIFKGLWHDAWIGINASSNHSLSWIDESLIQYRIHSHQQVGIGNGTTVNKDSISNSTDFLIDIRTSFENCLIIIDSLKNKYSEIDTDFIKTEATNWIHFINLRLYLPTNIFLRTYKILENVPTYIKHSASAIKTILNDIFNPKRITDPIK
ncbi:MAG: glycosyltransferase [Rickettsiales bacterium]|nr:MAG: glycosyltransferase [Rickettsiales bacterium]